ncbi:uncharacterized protein LOC135815767 [Sycon ciliatum]|uniref:uncharacterized protein LOC135815767 n=1 Tax=Sycon ciliatum TaxID=27933 RepID=UPI0020AD8A16|eukprot:scpid94892/ scgid23005/ 
MAMASHCLVLLCSMILIISYAADLSAASALRSPALRRFYAAAALHQRRGSGDGYAPQSCRPTEFYCHGAQHTCMDAEQCCPVYYRKSKCASRVQLGPDADGCLRDHKGGFEVHVAKVEMPMPCMEGALKKINLKYYHEGVQYRGFVYEFGGSYPNGQALDVMDPMFKYKHGAHGFQLVKHAGSSTCTHAQAVRAMHDWTATHSYKLLTQNCQSFAKYMVDTLLSGCVDARPRL